MDAESRVILELKRLSIPAHWNVAWSLCVNLQLMAHGPGLPSLFWKLLEVRDKEQISLNLHGTLN